LSGALADSVTISASEEFAGEDGFAASPGATAAGGFADCAAT
jgi:hypothetical protein